MLDLVCITAPQVRLRITRAGEVILHENGVSHRIQIGQRISEFLAEHCLTRDQGRATLRHHQLTGADSRLLELSSLNVLCDHYTQPRAVIVPRPLDRARCEKLFVLLPGLAGIVHAGGLVRSTDSMSSSPSNSAARARYSGEYVTLRRGRPWLRCVDHDTNPDSF